MRTPLGVRWNTGGVRTCFTQTRRYQHRQNSHPCGLKVVKAFGFDRHLPFEISGELKNATLNLQDGEFRPAAINLGRFFVIAN
jgi:hypothetical protein